MKNVMIGAAVVAIVALVALIIVGKVGVQGFQSGGGNTLTMYYADWCPHCTPIKDGGELANLVAQGTYNGITLQRVEATTNPDIIKAKNIQGFPTILLEKNGKTVEFSGPRTADAVKAFIDAN